MLTSCIPLVLLLALTASAQAQFRAASPPDLDVYVARVMKAFAVPAVSLAIVKDGRVVVSKGYGIRKLGEPTAADARTLFGIASNTKLFTATALGLLVEEGMIEWDAPVVRYLPWFQMWDPYVTRELTVRDLLVHRSGLGLGAGDLLWWPSSTYDRKEIARRLRFIPPATNSRQIAPLRGRWLACRDLVSADRYLGREADPELEITRAAGSYVFNARGRKYIDFLSGWCVGNLGWNHPTLIKALREFRGPDYVYPELGYKPWRELARLLAAATPGRLTKSFRATGGSEAIELALQAAMLHTNRRRFLALEDGYHGNTIGALSIGSSENRETYPNLLESCEKITPPLDERALKMIETRLKRRDVAAFVMEPISINLGVLVPSRSFMTKLQRLCRRYGTLLVMDEVACGFGRTGTLFATEQFDIEPDIICLGKAITGGALGLGAMITTPAVGKSMEENGSFWSTYGWHPRSVAVAIATIRYMTMNRRKLMAHVAVTSANFEERLSTIFAPDSELHISGLAIAIDVRDDRYAEHIRARCLRQGLILTTQGSRLLLLPALTIDPEGQTKVWRSLLPAQGRLCGATHTIARRAADSPLRACSRGLTHP